MDHCIRIFVISNFCGDCSNKTSSFFISGYRSIHSIFASSHTCRALLLNPSICILSFFLWQVSLSTPPDWMPINKFCIDRLIGFRRNEQLSEGLVKGGFRFPSRDEYLSTSNGNTLWYSTACICRCWPTDISIAEFFHRYPQQILCHSHPLHRSRTRTNL